MLDFKRLSILSEFHYYSRLSRAYLLDLIYFRDRKLFIISCMQ